MREASSAPDARGREWARYRTVRDLAGHAVRAHIVTHRFVPHAHQHHTVVIVERGALAFRYRGADHVARAGQIALINAAELHTGAAVDAEGCTYAALAVTPHMIDGAARALGTASPATLHFAAAVVEDRTLWWHVARMRNAVCIGAPVAEARTHAQEALAWLVARHMVQATPRAVARAHVRQLAGHIEANYAEPLSLRSLGA